MHLTNCEIIDNIFIIAGRLIVHTERGVNKLQLSYTVNWIKKLRTYVNKIKKFSSQVWPKIDYLFSSYI